MVFIAVFVHIHHAHDIIHNCVKSIVLFREKFGGKLKAMISGGALLPPHIEKFFALTGLNVRF